MRYLRNVLGLCLLLLTVWGLSYFCKRKTGDFTLMGITPHPPFNPAWETPSPTPQQQEEIDLALSQPYHYLGKGGQCFVFASADGAYVIKFFKQKTYTIPLWHALIPPYLFDRYKEKKQWKRQDKIQRDFWSYKYALEVIPEQTGVLFVHLNPTEHLQRRLTFTDRLHIAHTVSLDAFDFVLQRRAEMISPAMLRMIRAGEIQEAKELIDNLCHLVLFRCMQGLEDRDPEVRTNCGLLGKEVIKIDVGRFSLNPALRSPERYQAELSKVIRPLQKWLRPESEELANYCEQAIRSGRTSHTPSPRM